jgi:peptide/nickel transport system ATP-binding protein
LYVTELSKSYSGRKVLRDVSFTIASGEIVGLLGESGSGKSTLARIIAGLVAPDSGDVHLGSDPLKLATRRRPEVLRAIQMIYQDPQGTLNPRVPIGHALARARRQLRGSRGVAQMLAEVGLEASLAGAYPSRLSGGQRQRVAIARAFAGEPRLVLADEPVSALDLSIQAGVLNLLESLQREHDVAMLFISHDTRVVRYLTDRVIVLESGRIVEEGATAEVFDQPSHPYTKRLLAAAELASGETAQVDRPTSLANLATGADLKDPARQAVPKQLADLDLA